MIFRNLAYRLRLTRMSLQRFSHRFASTVRALGITVDVLTVTAALICSVGMLIYVGFDHSAREFAILERIIHCGQAVFLFNIVYGLLLTSPRRRTLFQWIIDIAVVLTIFPLIFPHTGSYLWQLFCSNRVTFAVIAVYSVVQLSYAIMRLPGKRTNPSLILTTSFMLFIIVGTLALMLPKSTYNGISFVDPLFVATSAVSITGLTPVDVAATFTPLGLTILGVLIEVGALGVITFTCFFAMFFTGNTSIYSQLIVRDIIYSKSMSSLLPTMLYVLTTTLTVQLIGAVALYFSVPDSLQFDTEQRIGFAVFHSVSAFCNAGFSSLPDGLSNPALMNSGGLIYWMFSLIIIAGAIGFPIIINFRDALADLLGFHRHRRRSRFMTPFVDDKKVHLFNMNTKIVLTTTGTLFAIGAIGFFILEYDRSMAGMSLCDKITQSVFNSVTPRSAGFSSIAPAQFAAPTLVMILFMMWVGGSAQSTAGGVKVNTLAAIVLNLRSIVKDQSRVVAFRRTIATASIRRANAMVSVSLITYTLLSVTILILEPGLPPRAVLFETCSALFTVGSSLGLTAELGPAAETVLCVAMLLGRVGIVSLLSGILSHRRTRPHYPTDNIIIN